MSIRKRKKLKEVLETPIEEISEQTIEEIQEVPEESIDASTETEPIEIDVKDDIESEGVGVGEVFVDEEGNIFDVDASFEFNNGKGEDEDE